MKDKNKKKSLIQWLVKWEEVLLDSKAVRRSRRVGTTRFEDTKQEKMRDLGI